MKLYIIADSEGWTSPYVITDLREAKRQAKSYFAMDAFATTIWFTISQIDTGLPDVTAQFRLYSDGREKTLFDIDAKE